MTMTAEGREQVATELRRFAADLHLTEEQKEKLQVALAEGREKVGPPGGHRADRAEIPDIYGGLCGPV